MVVAFDTGMLLLYLDPLSAPPTYRDENGHVHHVPDAHARVEYLIQRLDKAKASIIVPTPALSEILVGAGQARDRWLDILEKSSRFEVAPFCKLSAIELSEIERQARSRGGKRGPTPQSSYQKVKFDRQIVMIARVNNAESIYGNDSDIRSHAEDAGLDYFECVDLLKPPQESQASLDLDNSSNSDDVTQSESQSESESESEPDRAHRQEASQEADTEESGGESDAEELTDVPHLDGHANPSDQRASENTSDVAQKSDDEGGEVRSPPPAD